MDSIHNGKATDGDDDAEHCICEAVLRFVGDVRDNHGPAKRGSPRRYTVQLGLDLPVAVALNDTWGEVGIGVCRDDEAKVHKPTKPDLEILENSAHVSCRDRSLPGRFTLIDLETRLHVSTLIFVQPLCILGEVGDDEEEEDGDNTREHAFEDENPAPPTVSQHSVHLSNGRGQKATKSASESGGTEEEAVALLSFVSAAELGVSYEANELIA